MLFLAAAGLAAPAAQAQVSTTAVPFLRIEPDSRAAGMGNTGVALADDANAVWWNPAGLGFQEGAEVGITHSNWLPEFNTNLYFDYLAGKYHVDGVGTLGGQVAFMNLGEHERRNNENVKVNDFRSFDLAAGVSYGVTLGERFALGTGARAIYSQLASDLENIDGTAYAVGVDLAALYRTRPFALGGIETTLSAGANLSNMGPTIDYDESTDEKDPLPQHLRFGAASTFQFDEFNELTVALDFGKLLTNVETEVEDGDGEGDEPDTRREVDPFYEAIFSAWGAKDKIGPSGNVQEGQIAPLQQITVGGGLEYWYSQLFALRTGYYYENPDFGDRQFLNFGAGLRYNIIGVDFSYVFPLEGDDPLANTIRISLLVDVPSASDGAGSAVAE
ncbi:MAG: hypothetical protein BRD48_04490 [Bacteroidetes bacterium QS_9_68_14]|nr:MAG: hypothetical protein BRD48_04490 [Bacteroidetes bacterium QS_9_68_14]